MTDPELTTLFRNTVYCYVLATKGPAQYPNEEAREEMISYAHTQFAKNLRSLVHELFQELGGKS